MPHNSEAQFHINEAINHLRAAAGNVLRDAPQDCQTQYRPRELAGNELLLIADHLDNVKKVATAPITLG